MVSQYLCDRLSGIKDMLMGVHKASSGGSSATIGNEREQFVTLFLSKVMPLPFRFGTGDATDESGNRSGQLDIVLEFPFLPSFPVLGIGPRLYLTESIAAVIEVKSNIRSQWKQVLKTAEHLASLKRNLDYFLSAQAGPTMDRIPFFAIGYEGWRKVTTVQKKLADGPIDGILVIEPGVFASSEHFDKIAVCDLTSLWWLIYCLQRSTRIMNTASDVPIPTSYVSE